MTKLDAALDWLNDSPGRRLTVITLSFGLALVMILPIADEYADLSGQHEQLTRRAEEARQEGGNLAGFRDRARSVEQQLAVWESRGVSDQRLERFRSDLVTLIRRSGCSLRRISVGEPRSREWLTEDHPLGMKDKRGKPEPTGYQLMSHGFSITVSGTMPDIDALLTAMREKELLAHTKTFSLRPEAADRDQLVLEMELSLFDLVEEKKDAA